MFNVLWYVCPDLITNGHVYSAEPPLFRVTTKKNEYVYLKDEKELNEYKRKHSKTIKTINRNKGLGEQNADELAECLLDRETRRMVQLTVQDMDKTDRMFCDLYGKNVKPRVDFLEKHLQEARVY